MRIQNYYVVVIDQFVFQAESQQWIWSCTKWRVCVSSALTEVMFTVAARWMIQTGTTSFSRRQLQVNAMVTDFLSFLKSSNITHKHVSLQMLTLCRCLFPAHDQALYQPKDPALPSACSLPHPNCITDEDDDEDL